MSTEILAPIAGKILEILVKEGDTVKGDDYVIKLDAMKMENPVYAISDGIVQKINVKVGDEVEADDLLIVLN